MNPVLLVHGINDTGARFDKLRGVLLSRGFVSVHAMNITPSDGSITLEKMGQQVMGGVLECMQQAGADEVDIVAFSMGALATRVALRDEGASEFVRRLVMVSGPHHGTLTAYLSAKAGTRQMRVGSRFLNDLNGPSEQLREVEVFSFWSPLDLVVIPASSSVMKGAHNQRFWVPLHHQMLTDERVIEAVVQALAPEGEERTDVSRVGYSGEAPHN